MELKTAFESQGVLSQILSTRASEFLREFEVGGRPRLHKVREYFLEGYADVDDLEGLKQFYQTWRDTHEYGLIQEVIHQMGENIPKRGKIFAIKLSKRGNDVAQRRILKRFGAFEIPKGDVEYFKFTEQNPKVKVVFASLTYDTSRGSRRAAWEGIGRDFNLWITWLRNRFGRISYVRCFESSQAGHPHIHCCLIFHNHTWGTFKTVDDQGNFIWRLQDKKEFEKGYHSFIDCRAVRTHSSVIRYLRKRAISGSEKDNDPNGDLSLSLCWLFRKRSYAISGEFRERLIDLIHSLRNSNSIQICLDGSKQKMWVWMGTIEASFIDLDPNIWCHELSKAQIDRIEWF